MRHASAPGAVAAWNATGCENAKRKSKDNEPGRINNDEHGKKQSTNGNWPSARNNSGTSSSKWNTKGVKPGEFMLS
jgi:hypothetical protein